MGLGRLFVRDRGSQPVQERAITEYAFLDGRPIYGSEFPNDGYRGGMAIPGAYRAATLLADLLGQIPWNAYRQRGEGPVEKLPTPPLLDQPNPPDPRVVTFSSMALDLIWHGNAIGVHAFRNGEGWPTAYVPVPADAVSVRRVTAADNSPLPPGEIEYLINGSSYAASEVIHIKGHCRPGELRGRGVLEQHFQTLELATEQSRQARSLVNHGVPTGIIKVDNPDAQPEDLVEMKAGWLKSQRERSIAFLQNASFQTIAWNPTETQLLDARKFSLHEIALIFGVPLSFLGVEQSSRTYTNVEMEAVNLIKFSLGGHLARFEQTLERQFPRGTWVKANLDAILRADTLTRYQAHAIALDKGFLTVNEVRDYEDRPPLTSPSTP